MQCSSLHDLIEMLEYGTKLHIGVLFFGGYGSPLLTLPTVNTIHTGEACFYFKGVPGQFDRCFRCRNLAISKALRTKRPFSGQCINGIFEYTHPITQGDEVVCIVFIGNILLCDNSRLEKRLGSRLDLISTMEADFTAESCLRVAHIIEDYIRAVLANEAKNQQTANLLIENVKKYTDDNLEYNIELSQVARLFHYNEKYLGRLFKKETGLTFKEYINNKRLSLAQTLLADTSLTVTEIAIQTGYNNVTYFNRIFKRAVGITPTAYRKGKKQNFEKFS